MPTATPIIAQVAPRWIGEDADDIRAKLARLDGKEAMARRLNNARDLARIADLRATMTALLAEVEAAEAPARSVPLAAE